MNVLYQYVPELNLELRIIFIFVFSVAFRNAAALSEPGSCLPCYFKWPTNLL